MEKVAQVPKEGFLNYSNTIGLATMEGRGFFFPSDTAIGTNGHIYTVNRGVEADRRGVRITEYNLNSDFMGTFGAWGAGDGQMISPTAIAIDSSGKIYVSDEFLHRIVVFETDGSFHASWGTQGDRQGEFLGPSGIAFDKNDDLYVADHRNHRIQKFDKDGTFLASFGSEGSASGQLDRPWGVTVDVKGEVYVADWRNDRVQKFSADGEFLGKYGTPGRGDGQFLRPSGVAVDERGYMYVADWGNERLQLLDPDGGFVTKIRGAATISSWAQDFLDANVEEAEARSTANLEPDVALFGGDPHEESAYIEKFFWAPVSVKLDNQGRIYVTESNRHRVQIYETSP